MAAATLPLDTIADPAPRQPRRWLRGLGWALAVIVALIVALWFLFTSAAPAVPPMPAPTAEQAGAGRDAVMQLRGEGKTPRAHGIRLGADELQGMAALASHGFRPARFAVTLRDQAVAVTVSRALPLGRWFNADLVTGGRQTGFPHARLRIGSVTFSPFWTRKLIETTRRFALWRGIEVGPLDTLVRGIAVGGGEVAAVVDLPRPPGPIDGAVATRLYCALAAAQRRTPSDDFATHVRRVFSAPKGAETDVVRNRAAFVALAIFLVDDRVAELADAATAGIAACHIAPPTVTIHGRADLPKHWSLSAAIAAASGTQFAQAIGEWKELADSLSPQSSFAIGDPSGFSFVDVSADRAGFRAAGRANEPGEAARLAAATPDQLLPPVLLKQPEGMKKAAFIRDYGSITDPRYTAMVAKIDAILNTDTID
ncbi:hypothetical protein ASG67_08810 [Sphingomonas sp. Leaf339]|uniref:hypothetical protein n=1 Tax=Sphingomonas sp. Leaf339 TaxID=1736343 RepID=UPI0006FA031F|nr:hypothetical protein [Sphingomonas sp. Leaf339]KQU52958.1 hypothetical protein ASG67_08810 [Sphingomonas sp. Leaf339]